MGQDPTQAGPARRAHYDKAVLDLHQLLARDSTFYGDLFPHVIQWHGELYLEDGLHRALRAALHQRAVCARPGTRP